MDKKLYLIEIIEFNFVVKKKSNKNIYISKSNQILLIILFCGCPSYCGRNFSKKVLMCEKKVDNKRKGVFLWDQIIIPLMDFLC